MSPAALALARMRASERVAPLNGIEPLDFGFEIWAQGHVGHREGGARGSPRAVQRLFSITERGWTLYCSASLRALS